MGWSDPIASFIVCCGTTLPVKGLIGNSDPVRAVSDAIGARHLEEVIVSTLP